MGNLEEDFGFTWFDFLALGQEGQGELFVRDPMPEALVGSPTLQWEGPEDGATLACTDALPIALGAEAVRGDAITRVAFLVDGQQVAQTSDAPYEVRWLYPSAGEHTLKAIVSTMRGQVLESVPVTVTVDCP